MSYSTFLTAILTDALWIFAAVGVITALIAGLVLLLAPKLALSFGDRLNREWSFSWVQRALDAQHRTEPFFYRHHRLVGFILVLATTYFFWTFVTAYSVTALVEMFDHLVPDIIMEILATVITWVLVIGNAVGFALGAIMLFRPSTLKGVEDAANTWVDTEQAADVLNQRVEGAESTVHQYPRRIGAVILIATLYIVLAAVVALN